MQRVINFFYTFVLILSININAEVSDEFVDLFVNELPCTNAFLEYIDDDIFLRNDFSFETDEEFNILKDIFNNYCTGKLPETINPISTRIFLGDNVFNKSLLYAIHSSKFAYHLRDTESLKIADIMIKEISFLNTIDTNELGSSYDISNIILNISMGINMFELSEFNEDVEKISINYGSNTNIMYTLVEKFIFNIVDDTFTNESLELIANTLFEIRIAKSNNLNYYGSPLERFGARDEIIKIYLANYFDGNLKYFELHNLIKSKGGNASENFILIEPTLDQVTSLNSIRTSFSDFGSEQKGYKNDSDKVFNTTINKLLLNKFNQNPEEVISNLILRTYGDRGNADCSFSDQKYTKKNDTLEMLLIEIQFLSYKLTCLDNEETLFDLMDKLKLYYIKVDNENLTEEDRSDALIEASLISLHIDLHLTKINLKDKNLDLFLDKFFSIKEIQFTVDKNQIISSSDDVYRIITLTQSFDLINTSINTSIGGNQKNYIPRLEILTNNLLENISFDIKTIKKDLLSKDISKTEKVFISKSFMIISLLFLNSISDFVPEYLDILIDDYESGIDPKREKQINEILELISFYLDNIDNIFESTQPEFIFKLQPLDKWFVFKDLLSLETTLNYVHVSAGLISDKEYFQISDKRVNQIISLRPDKISLEKFKSFFIKENNNLSFIEVVKRYDQIQKNYRELLESKIILSKNIFDLSAEDRSSLETKYKYELQDIQGELFKEENIGLLFKHDAIDSEYLDDFLEDEEIILSFLSGQFFSVGAIQKKGMSLIVPLALSRTGFEEKSDKVKESFGNPNNSIPYDILSNLKSSFFKHFNLNEIKKIYIVTDEIFSGFPFHALYDDQTEKWLIDEYDISYLSGEKLLPYLDKRKIRKKNSFLGFGNPSLNKNNLENQIDKFFSERGNFPIENISQLYELPDTESELKNISKYFSNSNLFFQNDATEENVFNDINKNYDFVAFATHSVKGINRFYNDRGLVLTPINASNYNNDGFLSSKEIKSINFQNNPTILLTACNTIDPQFYLSLPYSGLASSFMEAGANGVLLSLWNVNSKSSSELNQGIFTNSNNMYFTEALRNSIINIKNQKEFSHPYYWAPYIYLGK
ncbi:CHAT domain-containing protein [Gammaproteobacteria bacterium]|nr:CHAT domain-containing protein [Gammaproteobacteria bacterium]